MLKVTRGQAAAAAVDVEAAAADDDLRRCIKVW